MAVKKGDRVMVVDNDGSSSMTAPARVSYGTVEQPPRRLRRGFVATVRDESGRAWYDVKPTNLLTEPFPSGDDVVAWAKEGRNVIVLETKDPQYAGQAFARHDGKVVRVLRASPSELRPTEKQKKRRLLKRMEKVGDEVCDYLDAKRLDMPVDEVRRRRKARLKGNYDFPPWHPCAICGREAGPRRWVCEECHGEVAAKVEHFLRYYEPVYTVDPKDRRLVWYGYYYDERTGGSGWRHSPEASRAVSDWLGAKAYLDSAGNFRYKKVVGKPITSWNKLVKRCFARDTDHFMQYCWQRRIDKE